jgi:hypothetical protein
MEWIQLVTDYIPPNPDSLTFYDQVREWGDQYRFWIIFVYLIGLYYLGFATRFRMPVLKMVLLYLSFLVGAVVFTMLDAFGLPIRMALFVGILLMLLVKVRLKPNAPRQE